MDWSKYPSFSPEEFACKGEGCCGGDVDMDPDFMERLQQLRLRCAFPFVITSGYRCHIHNAFVNGGIAHPLGKAADIATDSGYRRFMLITEAPKFGFNGIGIAKTFTHLDTLSPDEGPRPSSWTYR